MRAGAASITTHRQLPWLREYGYAVRLTSCFLSVALAAGVICSTSATSLIWIANGVLLAYLLLASRRHWPAYFATGYAAQFAGSVLAMYLAALLFVAANLTVGITISSFAKNQLQAVQMAFFFFLPSLLLSGYMFPFRGMPGWAQDIGEVLPLTHFLRVVRGILLKGNGYVEIVPDLWPIALFLVVMLAIGIKRYRQTLD